MHVADNFLYTQVIFRREFALVLVAFCYLALVRILRYRRRDGYYRKYGYSTSESFASMTLNDAFAIQRELAMVEFPITFSSSIFFALFKTYGIPTISSLLMTTGQLGNNITASKRAADTGVIITEIVLNDFDSGRRIDGIARINFLHDRYRRAGKISDDDMLYTLSLFALEPIRWTERFEWRSVSSLERCALGMAWKDLGEAMEIPYDALEPFMGEERDGLACMDAIAAWSIAYEKDHLVAAESNRQVSRATLDIALFNVPVFLRPFALKLIGALLDPKIRQAMMLDEPSWIHEFILNTVVQSRKFVLRYLCLPRPSWLRVLWFTDTPDQKTCKYHAMRYVAHPWYIKPSVRTRWSFEALRTRLWGGVLPGDGHDGRSRYCPEGYLIPELGPEKLRGKGETEMAQTRLRLLERCKAANA